MSREKRMKASDVFRETNYVFSQKVPFREAFPEIKSLSISVEESGYGVHKGWETRHYSLDTPPGEFIDCSNPICYNGGFSICNVIRRMIQKKETHHEGSAICQGYEGSPKGRRKYRDCINYFKYVVDIEYRNEK